MELLKKIVNDLFNADLSDNTRRRSYVDARKVYSKILSEEGYCYGYIGDTIGKDRTTILHYIKSFDNIILHDSSFRKKYELAKNKFVFSNKNSSDQDIYGTAIKLKEELDLALLKNKNMLNEFIDYLENYEKEKGCMPDINYCKENILPLFTG